MRRIGAAAILLILLGGLSGCCTEADRPESVRNFWCGLTEKIARLSLTRDADLIGRRVRHEDTYTGWYRAECAEVSGRDVVFGGGEPVRLRITGRIHTVAGTACVQVRHCGREWIGIAEDGCFDTVVESTGERLYIGVGYENFEGCVEWISEREPAASCRDVTGTE